MRTAAVILAAGASSRMKAFKPLLKIEGKTFADRVIEALRDGGADDIILVTGHCAEELRAGLTHSDPVFVFNDHFAESGMLESFQLGLRAVPAECDGLLLTPADLPLFTADTVRMLTAFPHEIVIPEYRGRKGHPVYLPRSSFESLLSYRGELGLKGAMSVSGIPARILPVEDEGILLDADTPEEYRQLQAYAAERRKTLG